MQDEVTLAASMQPNAARGDFVVRQGTFFRVGEYPDKQFGLTETEADAAIEQFAPVPLNIEHIPTIFDGKLGFVQRLWREGENILAEYAIPRWLQDVTQGEAIKISSEWSRTSKQPIGGAFVLHPRVADAVMQAAFCNSPHPRPLSQKSMGEGRGLSYGPFSQKSLGEGRSWQEEGERETWGESQKKTEGHLRGAGVAVRGVVAEEYGSGPRGNVGKELVSMSLLAGLRALFQRAGVSSEEIDAHLQSPDSEGANRAAVTTPNSALGTVVLNSAGGVVAEDANLSTEEAGAAASDNDAARFAAMEAELDRLRQQAQDAEQAARFTVDTRLIDGWVRAFQMTPAEAEAWRLIAQGTPAAFAAAIPALNTRPRLPQLAGGATVKASESADVGRLEALTQQKMRASGLDHTAAFKEVCGENRDLAQAVRARSQEGN